MGTREKIAFVEDREGPRGRPPFALPLFDPSRIFAALELWLFPLVVLRPFDLLLAAVGGYAAAFRSYEFLANADRATGDLLFWQSILLGTVTTNLFGKSAQGIAMARNGLKSREFGIALLFGVLPRIYIDNRSIRDLDFRAQRDCYAASLRVKLRMFALAAIVWSMQRQTGSGMADAAVAIATVAIASLLMSLNPLLSFDGYRWLSARLERPRLRQESFQVLSLVLRRRGLPQDLPRGELWVLLLFAIASVAFTAFVVFLALTTMALLLELQFRGNGVILFCLIVAMMAMFLVARMDKRRKGKRRGARGGDEGFQGPYVRPDRGRSGVGPQRIEQR